MSDLEHLPEDEFRYYTKNYIEELMGRLDAFSERLEELETRLMEVDEAIDDLWGAMTDDIIETAVMGDD